VDPIPYIPIHKELTMKPALALPLALALLFVVSASAAPPVIDNIGPFEVDYVAFDHTICPDLAIHDDEVYSLQQRAYEEPGD
jgi:hypothetical protein